MSASASHPVRIGKLSGLRVLVAEDEWIATAHWLYDNWNLVGGLSFLPSSNSVYELGPKQLSPHAVNSFYFPESGPPMRSRPPHDQRHPPPHNAPPTKACPGVGRGHASS